MKIILLFILLFIISFKSIGQNWILIVNDSLADRNTLIHKRDKVKFKLCNINPFIYDYKIQSNTISFDLDDVPDVINSQLVDLEGLTGVEPDDIDKMLSEVMSLEIAVDTASTKAAYETAIEKLWAEDVKHVRLTLRRVEDVETVIRKLRLLVETKEPVNIATIVDEKNEIINDILGIDCSSISGSSCRSAIDDHFRNALSSFERAIAGIKLQTEKYSLQLSWETYESIRKIDLMEAAFDKESFDKTLDQLLKLYDQITPSTFCIEHTFTAHKADAYRINYGWKSKENITYAEIPKVDIKDSLSLLNGNCRIDFSSGLFVTGLADHEFTTSTSIMNGDTTMQIARKSSDNFDLSAGALIHIYCPSYRYITPTLSFGASLNGNNQVRYLAGGGLMFGRKPRVILNGGLSIGKVKRLAENQTLGDVVSSFDEVQIIDETRASWFVGLTYNF